MTRITWTIALGLAVATTGAAAQERDIDKLNGGIRVEAGQAAGDLGTVNGSIRIGDGARIQDAETVNGSIQAGDDLQADDLSTVNGSIRIGKRARIDGGLETVNGQVFVDAGSRIGRGVETVNGAIGLVGVDMHGGIVTVNGDITVGAGSHVRGGIRVEKSTGASWFARKPRPLRIVVGPGAVVDGPVVLERPAKVFVHRSARTGNISGPAVVTPYEGARPPAN